MSDGTEALLSEARRAQKAVFLAAEADVAADLSRIIRGLADALEACSRRSGVPEPSAECPKCGVRATGQTPSTFYTHHDETCDGALEEPQCEPSDAQDTVVQEVSRLAGLRLLRRYSGFSDHWWDELVGGIARVALRAAGEVTR